MEEMKQKRDTWSSSFGFIMAAAGSAVGLGNIWKFPYLAGMRGGGAFVIIYLVFVFLVGFSVALGEMAIGRFAQSNAVTAYGKISSKFKFVGYMGVLASFVILSFYSVIGGWILKYIFLFFGNINFENSGAIFTDFIASPAPPAIWHIIFLAICVAIVMGGVSKGIEKASSIMMPTLFALMIIVALRSVTLPNAIEGIKFYLIPNFEELNLKTISIALGQVFFSLSLGMGTLITYGSYLSKKENMIKSTGVILGLDTLASILAGFAILPAVFAFGLKPDVGPSLLFITLPKVFEAMPFGVVVGILFFVLVLFAAITSVISLLEVIVSYMIELHHFKRRNAVLTTGVIVGITGVLCSLSQGVLQNIKIWGYTIFDFLDALASNILLPAGGFLMCIVIGYIWKPKNAVAEITRNGITFRLATAWTIAIKYILPIAIILILLEIFGIIG